MSDPNQIESLRQLCARLFPLEEDLENASLRLRRWARKTRADGFVRYGKNLRNQDFLRALALDQQLNAADGSVVGPLELLNAALLSAVERGDVSEMTTLALSHARWSERTAGESPLDALRAGSLNRARALVARNPADRRALWRLLLAWELNATGQLSDAETVLRDGAKDTDRPEVSALLSDQAVALLPRILEVDPEGFHFLQRTLLGDNQRLSLCQALGREGQPHHAMRVAAKLPDHGSRVFATRAFMGPLISFPGLVDAVVTTALRCPARPDGAGGCVAGPDAADPIGSVPSAQPADADDLTGVDLTAVDLTGIEAPPEPGYLEHCLAVAYAHCQEFAMARAAIDELLRAPDRARRALGHHALECVAVAHAAAGDLDLAAETLAEISHTYMHHGRVVGTVAFIGALAGRAEDAARLAERALAPEPSAPSGRSTDPRPLDLVLAKIVFGAARGGAVDVAMGLAKRISDPRLRAGALSAVAFGLVATVPGEPKSVKVIVDPEQTVGSDLEPDEEEGPGLGRTLTQVALGRDRAGDPADARALLARALGPAVRVSYLWIPPCALADIAVAQAESGAVTQAQATMSAAQRVVDLLFTNASKDDEEEIEQVQRHLRKAAEAVRTGAKKHSEPPPSSAIGALGEAAADLSEQDESDGVTTVADRMVILAKKLAEMVGDSTRVRSPPSAEPAAELARSGDYLGALREVENSGDGHLIGYVEAVIAQTQARTGEPDVAVRTAHDIRALYWQIEALRMVGAEAAARGLGALAGEIFDDAVDATFLLAGPPEREAAPALVTIATTQLAGRRHRDAATTLGEALRLLRGQVRSEGVEKVLSKVVWALVAAGEPDEAMATALSIGHGWFQGEAMLAVVMSRVAASTLGPDEARALASQITSSWWRAVALTVIAAANRLRGSDDGQVGLTSAAARDIEDVPQGRARSELQEVLVALLLAVGDIRGLIEMAKQIVDDAERRLTAIAKALFDHGHVNAVPQLLPKVATRMETTCFVVALLARAHPDHAPHIVAEIERTIEAMACAPRPSASHRTRP